MKELEIQPRNACVNIHDNNNICKINYTAGSKRDTYAQLLILFLKLFLGN